MRKVLVILLITFSLVLSAAPFASAVLPAYKVSMTVNKTVSEAGKFVIVSGKVVGPKAAGKNVTIQRRYVGGAWTTVAFATVKSTGNYAARVETPRGGTTSFRVIKGKSSVRRAGVSPVRALKVYEWLYLANEGGSIDSGNVLLPMEQTIDGVNYRRSIGYYNGDAAINYKLAGMCTKFAARVGYRKGGDPAPDSLSFILSRLYGTTSSQTTTPVEVNTSVTVTSSMVGARSMQINMASIVDNSYTGALGDPRVYCNADHLPSYDLTDF